MEVDSSGDQEWEAIEAAQANRGAESDGLEAGNLLPIYHIFNTVNILLF